MAKKIDELKTNSKENEENNELEKREETSLISSNIQEDIKAKNNTELEVSKELAEERLNVAMSMQKPQKKKKSIIVSLVLLIINVAFMIFIINGLVSNIGEQNFFEYIKTQGARLWWLVGGLGCYIIYIFSQCIMFHALIKSTTGKSDWRLSYNLGLTGKYYDNVTPFAVGGQPMQIIELSKTGISPGVSTSIPLIKMIINGIISTLLALLFFIFGLSKITPINSFFALLFVVFQILGIVGLVITLLTNVFMLFLSTGTLFTRSLIAWIVKLGYKLKIVKNYRASLKKWLDQAKEYKNSMQFLLKNKKLFIKMILYSCLESLSYALISFFVIMAFLDPNYMTTYNIGVGFILFSCVVKYYICSMAGSYIPLPGATGLMEIAFIALYGEFVGDAIVWALLTWRLLSYYLILIHGFIFELIKIISNVSKNKKDKRLQNEIVNDEIVKN